MEEKKYIEMKKQDVCPLMSYRNHIHRPVYCCEHNCALWIPDKACGILYIGLKEI